MEITVDKIKVPDDVELYEITLINDKGSQVKLLNYGATIEKILIATANGLQNMVLSLSAPEDYLKERTFLGAAIGRVAGRIREGIWQNESQHLLSINEGRNHLHGGFSGFDTSFWSFETSHDEEQASVTFSLLDEVGKEGYPGNLQVEFKYTFKQNDELRLDIKGISDETTLFNPTSHVYFNLSSRDLTIDNHYLQFKGLSFLPLDAENIPTGERCMTANSTFDFVKPKKLADIFNENEPQLVQQNGLNHPFLFDEVAEVVLNLPEEKRRVILTTSYPSVVIYSGNHFDGTEVAGKLIPQHAAIALEAQIPPSPDNRLEDMILEANKPFTAWINWQFEVEE